MTLGELTDILGHVGSRLTLRSEAGAMRLVVRVPAGADRLLSDWLMAEVARRKDEIKELLARAEFGPPPDDPRCGWRGVVASWPVPWRRRWGRRLEELERRGLPWDWAEWGAYCECEAARRGGIEEEGAPACPSRPGSTVTSPSPHPGGSAQRR